MISVAPGTVVIFSDIACPWAHLTVHRLWSARERLGLDGAIAFDHRAFPLEIFNERATPKRTLDAEVVVAGGLDPGAGWHTWDRPAWDYPVSTLPALEAVQAAKDQGLRAGEELDRALRRAFFRDRRNITMRHEILAAAQACDAVDETKLADDLDSGRARRTVFDHHAVASSGEVKGSPHVFLPDGGDVHNPGVQLHWEDGGIPVIDKDDPNVFEMLLRRAEQET